MHKWFRWNSALFTNCFVILAETYSLFKVLWIRNHIIVEVSFQSNGEVVRQEMKNVPSQKDVSCYS